MIELYRCPNTGKIIELMTGDDKAFCNCGKANPKVPTEPKGLHLVKTGVDRSVVLLERADGVAIWPLRDWGKLE